MKEKQNRFSPMRNVYYTHMYIIEQGVPSQSPRVPFNPVLGDNHDIHSIAFAKKGQKNV